MAMMPAQWADPECPICLGSGAQCEACLNKRLAVADELTAEAEWLGMYDREPVERFTYKCKLCGAAMETDHYQVLVRRMEHHMQNHRASGWEG